jgi:hypothetical protein
MRGESLTGFWKWWCDVEKATTAILESALQKLTDTGWCQFTAATGLGNQEVGIWSDPSRIQGYCVFGAVLSCVPRFSTYAAQESLDILILSCPLPSSHNSVALMNDDPRMTFPLVEQWFANAIAISRG